MYDRILQNIGTNSTDYVLTHSDSLIYKPLTEEIYNSYKNHFRGLSFDEAKGKKKEILFCNKCNAPKETYLGFNDFFVGCICKCDKEREDNEAKRIEAEREAKRLDKAIYNCFGNQSDGAVNFGNVNNTVLIDRCKSYYETVILNQNSLTVNAKRGLAICGQANRGKTYALKCICNELLKNKKRVKFTYMQAFLNSISSKSVDNDKYIKDLTNTEFIVLDDFRIEQVNDIQQANLDYLLDLISANNIVLLMSTKIKASDFSTKNGKYAPTFCKIKNLCYLIDA